MLSDSTPSSHGILWTVLYRMVRSARLDGKVFRSLREDTKANGQSILVLGLGGLFFGSGIAFSLGADLQSVLFFAVLGMVATVLIGFLWLTLTFFVGTRVLGGTSSYWGLARPLFFSFSPAPLFLLTLIPVWPVPELAVSAAVAWISVASVIAVKNSLGIDNQRSLVAFIIAALVIIFLYGFFQSVVSFSF
ncbi:MAG TPA: YIP1 family protein [Candidatus Bathyarchaeia archaeon]|nr:YIP1 family protein [Candidatus Bathyarchaeia archaeon]